MDIRQILSLLCFFYVGCVQPDPGEWVAGRPCVSVTKEDSSGEPAYSTVRGALLGTRFASLEALKSAIQIEYGNGMVTYDSTVPESDVVRVRHCSGGRVVVSVLEKGINEGVFLRAWPSNAIWNRFLLLFRSPYAARNREDLRKVHALLRRKPEWFGAGDLAFYDIAKMSVARINTPDIAFINPQDSTEKGYLNTMNHMTAQAFITTCFSEELADFVADVHERYRHPELITGKFSTAQAADLAEGPVDNYVDLVNNEWGQELGKQLKAKYGITRETNWTPDLLANYLNDLLRYYSWAFQVGFRPFEPEDDEVIRFSHKLDALMKGHYSAR